MKDFFDKVKVFPERVSPEKFFIFSAVFFGIIFLIITPPFQTPDEPVHFFRAYQISQLNFVIDSNDKMTGGYLPNAVANTVTDTATKPIIKFQANKKYDYYKTFDSLSLKVNQKNEKFYDLSATALYPPTSYAPQALGIKVASMANAPPIVMMYMGRLFNLATWIAICALAIRLMPRKKWAIVFLSLLPMAIFGAVSLNTDVITSGSALLFFTYILRLRESKKLINKKQIAILLFVAMLMCLSKQVMLVFLPLFFLLPSRLFTKKKAAFFIKTMLIVVPLMAWLIWFYIIRNINLNPSYINGQLPPEQLKFIVLHPYSYINVLWNTYFFTWGDTITRSFIGSFGWVDAPLSEGVVVLGYLGLAFTVMVGTIGEKTERWLGRNQKILVAGVAALYWLAVSTALYMYSSPVGFKIIVGLQGRYFFLIAILLVPVFYSNTFKSSQGAYRRTAVLTPLFLLTCSVITIYVRYYVNNV